MIQQEQILNFLNYLMEETKNDIVEWNKEYKDNIHGYVYNSLYYGKKITIMFGRYDGQIKCGVTIGNWSKIYQKTIIPGFPLSEIDIILNKFINIIKTSMLGKTTEEEFMSLYEKCLIKDIAGIK